MFKKALQRVQKIASNSPAEQSRPLRGMGEAMRSGSGMRPQPGGLASMSEQQIQNLAGQAQQRPIGIAGMGAAMRSGSGLMPVASQAQQSPTGVSGKSMMSAFNQPIVRAPGQPVQVPNTSGTPAGLGAMGANPLPRVPQGMKKGGKVKVSSASKRADGIAVKGKTRGKIV